MRRLQRAAWHNPPPRHPSGSSVQRHGIRHPARLVPLAFLALIALGTLLLMLPAWLFVHLDAGPWYALAAASALAGAFVERWLFFAEARHLVTLYY